MARKKTPRRLAVSRARLVERCGGELRNLGFRNYRNAEFQKARKRGDAMPERYIVFGYQHVSLYGGRGAKEVYVNDCGTEYIIEAKLQSTSGSVDEKMPYLAESWRASSAPNWIIVFDGNYWLKNDRGKSAVEWLRRATATPRSDGGRMYVCAGNDEWWALTDGLFKRDAPELRHPTPAPADLFA